MNGLSSSFIQLLLTFKIPLATIFPSKTCNKRCNYLRGIKTSFSQIHTRTARMKKGEEWNFWQSVAKNSNFLVKFYFSSSSLIFILFSDSQIGCCVTSYSICARLAQLSLLLMWFSQKLLCHEAVHSDPSNYHETSSADAAAPMSILKITVTCSVRKFNKWLFCHNLLFHGICTTSSIPSSFISKARVCNWWSWEIIKLSICRIIICSQTMFNASVKCNFFSRSGKKYYMTNVHMHMWQINIGHWVQNHKIWHLLKVSLSSEALIGTYWKCTNINLC